jgi:three-Cys-motif partner protein
MHETQLLEVFGHVRQCPPMALDLPEVGPWAADKLARLRQYLQAYTTVLSRYSYRFVYIDAFAGAGSAYIRPGQARANEQLALIDQHEVDEETRQVIDGSPLVALRVEPPFTAYVFVEQDAERLRNLEQIKKAYAGRREVRIYNEDCTQYLQRLIQNPEVDWRKRWRALVFLDPFGLNVPWSTIAGLAATRGVEILLNFPMGMAINRMLPRNPGQMPSAWRTRLDLYFGDPEWYAIVYEDRAGLFERLAVKRAKADDLLLEWYRERLARAFGHVSPGYLVENSRGNPLYYLIWAGPRMVGRKIATHVLRQGKAVRAPELAAAARRRGK